MKGLSHSKKMSRAFKAEFVPRCTASCFFLGTRFVWDKKERSHPQDMPQGAENSSMTNETNDSGTGHQRLQDLVWVFSSFSYMWPVCETLEADGRGEILAIWDSIWFEQHALPSLPMHPGSLSASSCSHHCSHTPPWRIATPP